MTGASQVSQPGQSAQGHMTVEPLTLERSARAMAQWE